MPPVLELLNVAVAAAHAPGIVVLENVDWTVAEGEFWVVGGLPSSGKSDLLATAAGLLRPARGVHRLFGRQTSELDETELTRQRLRIGIVFGGEGRLFRHLTVEENLALPLCYHRNCEPAQVRDRLDELLDWTGLTTFARRLPAQVSRSLWPRIALARALALQPELLFLDNPFRELDPPQRRWWLDFLGRLRSRAFSGEGRAMTIVAATDDLSPWIGPGERFALIADNQWRPIGGRAELSAFNEPLLRELLHDEG